MSYHYSTYILQPRKTFFGLTERDPADVITELDKFVELPERPKLSISVYKMDTYTIDNYNPDYPYLVTVDGGEKDEFWWVGQKEAEDLEHSYVTDKYKQLLYPYEIRHVAKEQENAKEETAKT